MKAEHIPALLAQVKALWPSWTGLDDDQDDDARKAVVAVWHEQLYQFGYEDCTVVLAQIAAEGAAFAPPPGTVAAAVRKRSTRRTRAPKTGGPCLLCLGTGRRTVEVASGRDAVTRCECQRPPLPVDEHKPACSCLRCHYGNRAAEILAGIDGSGGRKGVDPLEARPAEVEPEF